MRIRQIKRNIGKNEQLYNNIVATPYGSLIKTFQILNGIDMGIDEFISVMKKGEFPYLEDKEFIKKTLSVFGYSYSDIEGKPVALCENESNSIFCPFIYGNGEVVLLPLFKDRRLLRSQEIAMANDSYKIIDWREDQ